MRLIIAMACLLNIAWAEDLLDEVIRGYEGSSRGSGAYRNSDDRDADVQRSLPSWARRKSETEDMRDEIERERFWNQVQQRQMIEQMERLNKNLESRR